MNIAGISVMLGRMLGSWRLALLHHCWVPETIQTRTSRAGDCLNCHVQWSLTYPLCFCWFCSLFFCWGCTLVSVFFFLSSNEKLTLNTTRMNYTKDQNYFWSVLQERKGDEACLFTKTLGKTLLKAVPFNFFFQNYSVQSELYGYTSEGIL